MTKTDEWDDPFSAYARRGIDMDPDRHEPLVANDNTGLRPEVGWDECLLLVEPGLGDVKSARCSRHSWAYRLASDESVYGDGCHEAWQKHKADVG